MKKVCKKCGRLADMFSNKECKPCSMVRYADKQQDRAQEKPVEGLSPKKSTKPPGMDKQSSLIRKLDKVYSQLVRLEAADADGMVKCYTCNKTGFWKGSTIECGHYISRGALMVRHTEINAKPQCIGCNRYNGGELVKFRANLVKEYSEPKIAALEAEATDARPISIDTLTDLYTDYQNRLTLLKLEKDIWRN